MRTDFDNLEDGTEITLVPRDTNPLTLRKHKFIFQGGYFYANPPLSSDVGPDYYMGDVLTYNMGFELRQ